MVSDGSAIVYSVFVVATIVYVSLVLGPCLVMQYLVSRWEYKSWLLYFYCFLDVMWLLSLFVPSSRYGVFGWSAVSGIFWSYLLTY